jgi:hypothetical protein
MKSNLIIFVLILFISINNAAQIPKSVYVVNTLGESMSIIDLENQLVIQPPKPLGLYANEIEVAGGKVYVVISGLNEIRIFDLLTLTDEGSIYLGSGTNPYGIAMINDSVAVISLLLTNQVAFVNVIGRQVETLIPVGNGPQGVLFSEGKVYVANSGFNGSGYDPGKVSVIDLNGFNVSDIDVGVNPQSLDVDIQGNIIVACTGDNVSTGSRMDIIDAQMGAVVFSQSMNQPITTVAVNQQNMAYLATYNSGVMVYDLSQRTFIRGENNPLRGGPAVSFDQTDNTYICHFDLDSVYVYSPSHQRIAAYLIGDGPISIAVYDPAFSSLESVDEYIPTGIQLFQNYPNPFNPQTSIKLQLPIRSVIGLDILNIRGQVVLNIFDGELGAGIHNLSWNGRDKLGNQVSSGLYFYRLKAPGLEETKSMMYLK